MAVTRRHGQRYQQQMAERGVDPSTEYADRSDVWGNISVAAINIGVNILNLP